jgi:hypothetical protein
MVKAPCLHDRLLVQLSPNLLMLDAESSTMTTI